MSVYTPSQVATHLCIEASTLRRWARFFATHLSPAAGPGNPRRYTDTDLTLLQHVKQLFDTGHNTAEVQQLLDDTSSPSSEEQPTSNTQSPGTSSDGQTVMPNEHHPAIEALQDQAEHYQRMVHQQQQQITDQQILIDQLQQENIRTRNDAKDARTQATQAHARAQQMQVELQKIQEEAERVRFAFDMFVYDWRSRINKLPFLIFIIVSAFCLFICSVFYSYALQCFAIRNP